MTGCKMTLFGINTFIAPDYLKEEYVDRTNRGVSDSELNPEYVERNVRKFISLQ
jgi:hypothetical protein